MILRTFITAGLATAPLFAFGQDLTLDFPLDCTLGETCYVQQYVDQTPGPGVRDFTCGPLSYEGHKGTDFGLPTRSAMRVGVPVLAMADGEVRGTRDAMPDQIYTIDHADQITGKECGNGVVLRHPGGWETQYCHLKQGSVRVRSGTTVRAGDVLGEVGLSGKTQFPHLHVSVRKDGEVVDPYDPDGQITCGAPSSQTLWSEVPEYTPGSVLSVGFSDAVPDYDAVKDGTAGKELDRTSPAMVFFGLAFGGQPNDTVRIGITGPDGEIARVDADIERNRAQFFRAGGKRAPRGGWPAGTYTGTFDLIRNGAVISSQSQTMTLTK